MLLFSFIPDTEQLKEGAKEQQVTPTTEYGTSKETFHNAQHEMLSYAEWHYVHF